MMEIFQAVLIRRVVEAHGKKWVTLHYIGVSNEDNKRDLYIAIPFDGAIPSPCSVIAVERETLPSVIEKIAKEPGPSGTTSE
jgi:hypothetical protein